MGEPSTIPLADASLDAALMASLYHELDDRPRFLGELRRALKGGGLLAVADWRPDGSTEHGPRPEHRLAAALVWAELEAAGFLHLCEHGLYSNHWVVTARAPG